MEANSPMPTWKAVLVIPFSPRAGFTAIRSRSNAKTAVLALFVVTVATFVVLSHPDQQSFSEFFGSVVLGLGYVLLFYAVLVLISTALMKQRGGEGDLSPNAKVFGFWLVWFLALTTIARLAFIPLGYFVYAIPAFLLVIWFFVLAAVALSASNYVPLRRTWSPTFFSLALAGVVAYGFIVATAVTDWLID